MRNIKELLQVMLDNKHLFRNGLCIWAYDLYIKDTITLQEYRSLTRYIDNNRPDYFSWTNLINSYRSEERAYYFPNGKIKPRIYWIKRHIKKNS